jgi:uncharacterized repeat protein (TIGR01451 family)
MPECLLASTNSSPSRRAAMTRPKEVGAAAVEFAIGALILITLLFAAVELGFFMQKENSLAAAIRTATRTAGSPCVNMSIADTLEAKAISQDVESRLRCSNGNRQIDDFFILRSLQGSLRGYWQDVELISIYRLPDPVSGGIANIAKNGGAPPPGCTTASRINYCNVYTATDTFTDAGVAQPLLSNLESFYNTPAEAAADLTGKTRAGALDRLLLTNTFNCGPTKEAADGTSLSRFMCATDRFTRIDKPVGDPLRLGNPMRLRKINATSQLGVYVKMKHNYITGFFGSGRTASQWNFFRIDPHPFDNTILSNIKEPPVVANADVVVTKLVEHATRQPGDMQKWVITLKNGPARTTGDLKDALTFIKPDASSSTYFVEDSITWVCAGTPKPCADGQRDADLSIPVTLEANQTGTVTIEGRINPALNPGSGGFTITNTAKFLNDDTSKLPKEGSAQFQLLLPKAKVEKTTTTPMGVSPGDTITYKVKVTNTGNFDMAAINLVDTLPSELDAVTHSVTSCPVGATCPAFTVSGSTLTASISLLSAQSAEYAVSGTVRATTTATSVTNSAEISTAYLSNLELPNPSSVTHTISRPKITTKLETDPTTKTKTFRGESVTMYLTLTNATGAGTGLVALGASRPSRFSSWTWSCTTSPTNECPTITDSTTLALSGVKVDSGKSVTLKVVATVAATAPSGLFTTTVNASIPTNSNTSPYLISQSPKKDLTLELADLEVTVVSEKSIDRDTLTAGEKLTYWVKAKNNTSVPVTGATLSAAFNKDTSVVTVTKWRCVSTVVCGSIAGLDKTGTPSATIDMAANAEVTFELDVEISASASGSLTLTGTVAPPVGVTESNATNNTLTDTQTINLPDLSIDKSAVNTKGRAGQKGEFSVVITNAEPVAVTGVTLTDTWAAAKFAAGSLKWEGCVATNIDTLATVASVCPSAAFSNGVATPSFNIPARTKVTFKVSGTIPSSETVSSKIRNDAVVKWPANTAGESDFAEITVSSPVVSITKTANTTANVSKGTVLTYTITVKNEGPGDVAGIVMTETLPVGLDASTAKVNCPACSPAVTNGVFTAGKYTSAAFDLVEGATRVFTVTATVTASSGKISNVASVRNPVTSVDISSDPAVNTVVPNDFSIVKTDNKETIAPGAYNTYVITVTNSAAVAANFKVEDVLDPAQYETAAPDLPKWKCKSGCSDATPAQPELDQTSAFDRTFSLKAGKTIVFHFTGKLKTTASGVVTNTATATVGGTPKSDPDDTTITGNSVKIVKSGNPTYMTKGTTYTYTLEASNPNGPSTISGVKVQDEVDLTVFDSVKWRCLSGPACGTTTSFVSLPSGVFSSSPFSLAMSQSQKFEIQVRVKPLTTASKAINTATVTPKPPVPADGTSTVESFLTPDISIVKSITSAGTTYGVNDEITYQLLVKNTGGQSVTATVKDLLPSYLESVGTPSCVGCSTTTPPTWVKVNSAAGYGQIVAAGGSFTITLKVKVLGTAPKADNGIENTATVSSSVEDPYADNNSSTATATFGDSVFTVDKTADKTNYIAGDPVTYTIVVRNTGYGKVAPTVKDTFPTQLTFESWSCSACPVPVTGTNKDINKVTNSLGRNESVTFTVKAKVPSPATPTTGVENTATVGLVTDKVSINITGPKLEVTKTADRGVNAQYGPGETVKYTITAKNTGVGSVTPTISDNFPTGLTFVKWTCKTGCSGTGTSSTFSVTANALTAGQSATVEVEAKVPDKPTYGLVTNTGRATATGLTAATGAVAIEIVKPVLFITKTANVAEVARGATLIYTVTVTNKGKGLAKDVTITDPYDAAAIKMAAVSWSCTGSATPASGTGSLSVTASIAQGAFVTCTVQGVITSTATGTSNNTAYAKRHSDSSPPYSAPESVPITAAAPPTTQPPKGT